ncbi:MAG TPA: aromatic ring-hydroxylating dioxygenase subunit alpha [Chloroflexota bacterium]|nr:aromatic ring-hydroxylating dioxygenase subunit alpha [Chloroflexota bacterium]
MHLSELIRDEPERGLFRVHRSSMTSREIFQLEQERIFSRSWLYLAHDSELRQAGEYRRKTMAGRPVFIVRGRDGRVRAFMNTCTHRGALVCRQDQGAAETFQCFYHGWTFNNQGELVGIPDQSGYSECFDRVERGLTPVPRLESYRGMWFVSFQPDIDDLVTYLGDLRECIDLTVDSAELLGGWEVVPGNAKYTIRANWKLLVENSLDGYHLPTVHHTYIDYMDRRLEAAGSSRLLENQRIGHSSNGVSYARGHGGFLHFSAGRTIANSSPLWSPEAQAEVADIRRRLIERYGQDRGTEMADRSRHLIIFPNLLFQDSHTGMRFRQVWPVAPDAVEVLQTDLVPRDESAELRAYRLEWSRAFLGPGGLATPDDVEALESCQAGFGALESEWSDVSRGMSREPQANDELQMRGFWREWQHQLGGRAFGSEVGDQVPQALHA